jgi:hypothetical protein
MFYLPPSRLSMRGGRVVTNARRDAVDAEVSHDERHSFADGKAVWSRRPDAGAKLLESSERRR